MAAGDVRLKLGRDDFVRPNVANLTKPFTQPALRDEIDTSPNQVLQEELEVDVLVERRGPLERDQKVNVAIGTFFTSGNRPE